MVNYVGVDGSCHQKQTLFKFIILYINFVYQRRS